MAQAQRVPERDLLLEARVKAHIRNTNSPETAPGLVTSRPLKGQPFIYIIPIHLDRAKRPDGREAPCPICSPHAPKYLDGALAWFPVEGVYRCIGIECAGKHIGRAESENAHRHFRETVRRNRNYEFLFENLGCVPQYKRYLEKLLRAAVHSEKLRRELGAAHVRDRLRKISKSWDGMLRVWEEHKLERVDPVTNEIQTVVERTPVEYGRLAGIAAIAPNYHVARDLRIAISKLDIIDRDEGEKASEWVLENAYDHPADMASFGKILRAAKPCRISSEGKIKDVFSFFTEENFERIAKFGADRRNSSFLSASVQRGVFRIGISTSRLISIRPDFSLLSELPEWPELRAPQAD